MKKEPYETMKVKKDTKRFIKIESIKQGFPTMDSYLKAKLCYDEAEKDLFKKPNKKGGFKFGF